MNPPTPPELSDRLWYIGTMAFVRFMSYAVGTAVHKVRSDMKREAEQKTDYNMAEVIVYVDGECRFVARTTIDETGSITEMAYDETDDLLLISGQLLRTIGGMRFRWWKDGRNLEEWKRGIKNETENVDGELPF